MKQKNLYLTVGIPGSGKSTFLQQYDWNPWVRIISRDEIRFSMIKEGDGYFDHEDEVFTEFVRQIQYWIDNKRDNVEHIIADATHLSKGSRAKLLESLRMDPILNPVKVNILYFSVPLQTCLERNDKREGLARVPDDTIRSMYNGLKFPSPQEVSQYNMTVYLIGEDGKCRLERG